MAAPAEDWENFFVAAGSPDKIVLAGFKNDKLKPLTGKTLAEVARLRGTSPEEAAMDLVIEDGDRVDAIYFIMSEANVRQQLKLPWVSFGSDEASLAPEGVFLKSNAHPRAFGNVARLLGKYVRDEKLIPLEAGHPAVECAARGEPQAGPPRRAQAGLLRGYRHLRSRHDSGPRDVRTPASIRDRHA